MGSICSDCVCMDSSTADSFFWFRLRRASAQAESNKSIPGQMMPLSFELSPEELASS